MSSKREKPTEEIVLELEGLALPSRVARAARMFADALDALGGDAGQVTMVVSNRTMRAKMRAWDDVGAARVRSVADVVENPLAAVQRHPEFRPVANAIALGATELVSVGGRFRRNRKRIGRLDDAFARVMLAAAADPPPESRVVEGTTEVYTSVLRVGRLKEGSAIHARIFVGGAAHDVRVDERFAAKYFDAAKDGGSYRIRVSARWAVPERGLPAIDTRSALALEIERWEPISGAQALRELRPLFSDDEADVLLASLLTEGDA